MKRMKVSAGINPSKPVQQLLGDNSEARMSD